MEKKKKSVLRRVLNWICTIVILMILAVLAFIVINNLKGGVTFIGNHAMIWVRTGSMEPTIPAQSYILVEKVNREDLKVGDVIIFRSDDPQLGGYYNTHRIVEIIYMNDGVTPVKFVTKGDNPDTNLTADDTPARASEVVGRYVKNLDTLTKIGRFLSTPQGLSIMILAVLLLTVAAFAPDIIAIVKHREEDKKKAEMDKLVQAEVERMKRDAEVLKPEGSEDKEDPTKPEETEETEPQKSETKKIEEE